MARPPFRDRCAASLGKTPKSGSPRGQTSLNRGAALAQKSPLPLPVLSFESQYEGAALRLEAPFSGWDVPV